MSSSNNINIFFLSQTYEALTFFENSEALIMLHKSLFKSLRVHVKVEVQNLIGGKSSGVKKNIVSHENKKAFSPFYHKIFLIENECKTPIGYVEFPKLEFLVLQVLI